MTENDALPLKPDGEPADGLVSVTCHGFRGFGTEQTLHLARPDGQQGSGLTILVGPNNAGKSSLVECILAASQQKKPEFSEGKRHRATNGRVTIKIEDVHGTVRTVKTVEQGGSETEFVGENGSIRPQSQRIFTVRSRREFDPHFARDAGDRYVYAANQRLERNRNVRPNFSGRIFNIQADPEKRKAFDSVLSEVLDPVPNWTIEQTDSGQHYLKFESTSGTHSSDGLGDGVLSVFVIVDALYDSDAGSFIAIDEPELSLHPELQERLMELFLKYSRDRQLLITTHAPKFIDWQSIVNGTEIARLINNSGSIEIHQLQAATRGKIANLLGDLNNPHTLGLDANEVFFLRDGVVLLEGQEDVLFLPKALSAVGKTLDKKLYGWGVGGAHKMPIICQLLKDLGFQKVVGILDKNVEQNVLALSQAFPDFFFIAQPADDIRYKDHKPELSSLLDETNSSVRAEFIEATQSMVDAINNYFS